VTDEETPIAWPALTPGTDVIASDGTEVGKVTDVIADREKDIFSGISFKSGLLEREQFAPADRIDAITTDAVRLTLDPDAVAHLEPYET
jgi:uncharacterized protein YrrD